MINQQEEIINKIAQNKLDFNLGIQQLLEHPEYNFKRFYLIITFFIFNAIPNKTDYNSEMYQNAISTIPLKPTSTPIVLLKRFPTKIAFNKLVELPENQHIKILISLVWIFKILDTERRNTECKNGCGHFWHES
nr:DUF5958 family protein [Flavobacterium sp. ASV13]